MRRRHQLPFGAEVQGNGETRFTLWAPAAAGVELILDNEEPVSMQRGEKGIFSVTAEVPGREPATSSGSTASKTSRTPPPATSPRTYTARARS